MTENDGPKTPPAPDFVNIDDILSPKYTDPALKFVDNWISKIPENSTWDKYQEHLEDLLIHATQASVNVFDKIRNGINASDKTPTAMHMNDKILQNFLRTLIVRHQVQINDTPYTTSGAKVEELEMLLGTAATAARIEKALPNSDYIHDLKNVFKTSHLQMGEKLNGVEKELTAKIWAIEIQDADHKASFNRINMYINDLREIVEYGRTGLVGQNHNDDDNVSQTQEKQEDTEQEDEETEEEVLENAEPYPYGYDTRLSEYLKPHGEIPKGKLGILRKQLQKFCAPSVIQILHVYERIFEHTNGQELRSIAPRVLKPLATEAPDARWEQANAFSGLQHGFDQMTNLAYTPSGISQSRIMELCTSIALQAHDLLGPYSRTFINMTKLRDTLSSDSVSNGEIFNGIYRTLPKSMKGYKCLEMYHSSERQNMRADSWAKAPAHNIHHGIYVDLMPQISPFIGEETGQKFSYGKYTRIPLTNPLKRTNPPANRNTTPKPNGGKRR